MSCHGLALNKSDLRGKLTADFKNELITPQVFHGTASPPRSTPVPLFGGVLFVCKLLVVVVLGGVVKICQSSECDGGSSVHFKMVFYALVIFSFSF